MADGSTPRRKPRVRKTAPTVREKAQAAQARAESPKPKKRHQLARIVKKPFKIFRILRIPSNPVSRFLVRILKFIGKILAWLVPSYFVNAWREVRQVNWPSRKETWRLTLAVIIFAIVFGALVAGVDKVIDVLFRKLVLK